MSNSRLLDALKILRSRKDLFLTGVHSRGYAAAAGVHTKCKIVNGVYVVTLDSPNVKVIDSNPAIEAAVIISGKPGVFIAGADISMIEACKTKEEVVTLSKKGHEIFRRIETSRKPFVAAIQGSCLGGGLETALACRYRIAVKDSKTGFGLPEVMLGLLPGGVGLPADNTAKYLEETAIMIAKDIASGKIKIDRSKKGLVDKLTATAMQWDFILDVIRVGVDKGPQAGFEAEAQGFGELAMTPQSK
ncbi:Hydroxyacyl-coenzyme A dehydrogenase, partial [Operophtera brumata]